MTVAAVASPFRGLAPFGDSELDALFFFGREREIEIVTASLIATRLTVLYGPSGVGKSSLLHAGVARRIREVGSSHAVARGPDLACVVFSSWADEAESALVAAIGDAVRPLVSPTAPEPPADAGLVAVAEHWSSLLDGDLCLVLDQLEELFVYRPDPRAFLDELAAAISETGLRVNVLLAIRDDELARLGLLKQRLPNVFANARRLDRLDRDAARAAILGPLQRWNEQGGAPVDVEAELVEAVIAETAVDADHVEAPYLQLVMERVWEEETTEGSRELRRATLERLGGARSLVREHLARAMSALGPAEQEAAARMFGHLVTPSGTKIAHRASDLAAFAHVDESDSRLLLETLGRERIVRPLDDAVADRRYEIFHDVLADAIVEWSARRELETERVASRERQRRLTVVAGVAGAVALVMVAIAVYALAQRSDARAQARHAQGAALAADALNALPTDPEAALRLARAAASDVRSDAVETVLRSTLQLSRERAVLAGGSAPVVAASFAGSRVATVDSAGTLRTYRRRSGGPSAVRKLLPRVRAAAFASSGTRVAFAGRRLVESVALDGGRSFAFRVPAPVRTLAVDGQGERVAVALTDGRIVVGEAAGPASVIRAPAAQATLSVAANGATFAGGAGHFVTVWRGRRQIARIDAGTDVRSVALSADGSLVGAACADGATRIWRVEGGGQFVGLGITPTPPSTVAFAPDGRSYAAGTTDGAVSVFETATGRQLAVLGGQHDAVTATAFSGDGYAVVAGAADGGARVWDSSLRPELSVIARPPGCCAAIAAAGNRVVVAAGRRVIEYARGRRAAVFTQPAPVTAVAAVRGIVVTGGRDGRVRIFGPSSRGFALGAPVTAVAATGTMVVAATGDGRVEVRTVAGRLVRAFHEEAGVAGLAVSEDGKLLATAGVDGVARVLDLRTGRLLHRLGHTKALTSVAFAPGGATLATAGFDHDIRVWDAATGGEDYRIPSAHFAVISGLAFSADGRWLVSAGPTTARLWYAKTGVGVEYLHGHSARLVGAVFAGRDIVTASVDGTVRKFRCDVCGTLDQLVALADRRIAATGGPLTPAERLRFSTP